MKHVIHPEFQSKSAAIEKIIGGFAKNGTLFGDGKRNTIKLFDLDGRTINVKSFQVPNLVNRIVYNFFRRSKAERSYEFANRLLEKGIGTPQPVGYFENFENLLLSDSYYISEHLQCDLTFRELITDPDYPEHDIILRQFVQFSYNLHENGIEFLDHTPGNTLIKKIDDGRYEFFLVDLNRMTFHKSMSLDQRINNLSKLTSKREMIDVMSDEYAKLYGKSHDEILKLMLRQTELHRNRFLRKRRIKKMLLLRK
ncbi:MAG: Kdo domain containing protein [Flavobacterium sp.]|uniref:lipopolysaccharide kinase InaA family protein n=1 Tax=Flavobacterium sp. TaxID=239 RepID=UPI00121EC473|nr:Kdo domain containing protein [Flavobacterium sp.]RZJ65803.1 MAG: Kdo domain containing protein [Flavobacterium sp.]